MDTFKKSYVIFVLAILMLFEISWAHELESCYDEISSLCENDSTFYFDNDNIQCTCQGDKSGDNEKSESDEPKRRALSAPFVSPPFPSADYQGSPLVGVPPSDTVYPLMKVVYDTPCGEAIKKSRIKAYGWVNGSGNLSTCKNSNTPDSYWIVPNRIELDQFVFRLEREVDSVQTDHVDLGFRSTFLYGIDYRYMTAGGWTSNQLLKHNNLYGYDFTEQYIDIYTPAVAQGMIVRIGRWIACPDIETQFAPDNYMGTHSLLFTFDTYTQTGVMATIMLNKNWTVQAAIHAGTDMAPWYKGSVPTGMVGIRWVSCDNKDSVYLVLNAINSAKFRRFHMYGQPLGHDNFNYLVGTWQHKFNDDIHTKTEGYFMWQRDAVVGGTPSAGPAESFGGGGGIGADIPRTTFTYGVVNYTMFKFTDKDFITVRNEIWRDEDGERSGFPGTYTSNAIGLSHNFNSIVQIRPEIGYYRNWNNPAFDLGKKKGVVLAGVDMTVRF
ncbi:MAG TPA: outer membrane beta-barrel protein [Waddliaceae bacterium]